LDLLHTGRDYLLFSITYTTTLGKLLSTLKKGEPGVKNVLVNRRLKQKLHTEEEKGRRVLSDSFLDSGSVSQQL
jgi:subtilisin family serine protease